MNELDVILEEDEYDVIAYLIRQVGDQASCDANAAEVRRLVALRPSLIDTFVNGYAEGGFGFRSGDWWFATAVGLEIIRNPGKTSWELAVVKPEGYVCKP